MTYMVNHMKSLCMRAVTLHLATGALITSTQFSCQPTDQHAQH